MTRSVRLVVAVLLTSSSLAYSQTSTQTSTQTPAPAPSAALPNAPGEPAQAAGLTTATVAGVAHDLQGAPVPGASVSLIAPGKLGERTTVAEHDGTFRFTNVAPGMYRVVLSAPGMEPYSSSEFAVQAGESVTAPVEPMRLSANISFNVTASPEQIAVAQVHAQEQQRVLGVLPNFYTSYIWDAQPMPAKQKYGLAMRSLLDPTEFAVVAGIAGAEQYNGTFPAYGPGLQGYGKRYGAALADSFTGRLVGSAILPSLFHQDPRYFYQGSGGFVSRTGHAVGSVFVTRGDSGHNQFNYSHLLGSLIAGAVSNTYHPDSSRSASVTFETFGVSLAGYAVSNLVREFLLRGLVPSVPSYANGKK
ncbi:MAG: carboxypeptidase regulatory-like domain-containing protein [Acidobacteriota bacterium]|nr:carboxypeptidase regulatory-like domain-containing protein [Acidobacteriota bacterium]